MLNMERKPDNSGSLFTGRNIYGLLVETSRGIDAVAEVLKALSKFNLTLVHMTTYEPVGRGSKGSFSFFLDFSESKISPSEVKRVLEEKVPGITVNIIEPISSGITLDTSRFPQVFLGKRAVIFDEKTLKALFIRIREKYGTSGEVFLFHEGYVVGEYLYDKSREMCLKKCDIWDVLRAILFASGIAEDLSVSINDDEIVVKVWNNIECWLGREKNTNKPFSHWLRGILAGFSSKHFDTRVRVVETKCIAKGDPYCEFVIV